MIDLRLQQPGAPEHRKKWHLGFGSKGKAAKREGLG